MDYMVRTEVFEGPFDLLLHLIARQQVDIWQVSLSKITEEYLAEIERIAPSLLTGVRPEDLARLAAAAFTPVPVPQVSTEHIAPVRLTVSEAVAELAGRLRDRGETTFEALLGRNVPPIEVVINLLALLELYKRSLIELEQTATFGAITVRWTGHAGAETDDLMVEEPHDRARQRRPLVAPRPRAGPRPVGPGAPGRRGHRVGRAGAGRRGRLAAGRGSGSGRARRRRLDAAQPRGDPPGGRRAGAGGHARRAGRRPPDAGRGAADRPGGGVRRTGPRVRPARGRRRLAPVHAPRDPRGGRGVPAGGAAEPAHPGGARDAGGGRLPAAGDAAPGGRGARRERRRRVPDAGHPWPHPRGGARGGPRPGRPVRHDARLPGAAGAARSRPAPADQGLPSRGRGPHGPAGADVTPRRTGGSGAARPAGRGNPTRGNPT